MSSVDHLRDFVNERLTAAAEEIFGVFIKTIAEYEEEIDRQRKLLDIVWKPEVKLHRLDAEFALTSSNVTSEEVLPETSTQPSTPEESKLSKSAVLGLSEVTADTENNDKDYCYVFIDFKELRDESLSQEVLFSSLEGVKTEQVQTETDVSHVQLVSSECSANEKQVQGNGRQTKKKRQKVLKRQIDSVKQTGQAALADGDSTAKSQSERSVSPVCGKSFLSNQKKQVKTHQKTNETTTESNFGGAQNKRFACDVCGKKFKNSNGLQIHSKLHMGIRDFKCQDCGKSFVQKEHLVVHLRAHSGERPYSCDTCGKLFYTRGHLKTHMKRLSGEKPNYVCDVCGQIFCQRIRLVQHQDAHTAEGNK